MSMGDGLCYHYIKQICSGLLVIEQPLTAPLQTTLTSKQTERSELCFSGHLRLLQQHDWSDASEHAHAPQADAGFVR